MNVPLDNTENTAAAPRIFLDCDGVLADFDVRAEEIFGMPPTKAEDEHGSEHFWATLRAHPRFYRDLPPMQDSKELFEAVKHLRPVILTGCPKGGWAEPQKLDWATEHFPNVTMITCRAVEKRLHMRPGDVLIDDRTRYKHLWEEAGGVFIVHTSAKESIAQLRELGLLKDEHSAITTKESHGR